MKNPNYTIVIKDTDTGEIVASEACTSRGRENPFSSGAVGYHAGFKANLVSPETGEPARFQASISITEIGSKARA